MARRRIKSTRNDKDVQTLKLGATNFSVLTNDSQTQFIFRNDRKAPTYNVIVGSEFDPQNLDKVRLIAYLQKNNKELIHGANCVFKVYSVDQPGWQETLLLTAPGVLQPNGYFLANLDEADFAPAEFDGGPTILIEAEIQRFKKKIKGRQYINHLGIYDVFLRLRRRVIILEASEE